jgi:DNA-binding beta-propeller fold protein YncE
VRFTSGGAKVVVGNAVSQSLSVIDVASSTEVHRIPGAGFQPTTTISFEPGVVTYKVNGFECTSDTLAVHPDNLNDQIDFFDLAAGTVTSIPCDLDPRGIAKTPNGSRVVISHFLSARKVSVVDPATQTITAVFSAPNDLDEPIATRPDGLKAAVAVQNGTQVLDLVSGAFSPVQSTASVNRLLSTPDGLHVLAVGFNGSLVSYATGSIVANLNGLVPAYVGAAAPADNAPRCCRTTTARTCWSSTRTARPGSWKAACQAVRLPTVTPRATWRSRTTERSWCRPTS